MDLKTQVTWRYRGLVWIGRLYYFLGWIGLALSPLVTLGKFIEDTRLLEELERSCGWDICYSPASSDIYILTWIFMSLSLALPALAFGISLGIQVGLTLTQNSEIKIDLLRRIAQQQSEADSVLRLQDAATPDDREEMTQPMLQQRR